MRFIDAREVEWLVRALRELSGHPVEHVGVRDLAGGFQGRTDPLENSPENHSLLLSQPRLAAEPHHVTIGIPGFQLPGVDNLLPLCR